MSKQGECSIVYTRSGALRAGFEYQDLQSAEIFVEWLDQPSAYRWIRLETMDGSLDDIQAEHYDGTRRLLQVKFGTDGSAEWDWDELLWQETGKRGPKRSLLQKWKTSLDDAVASGVRVSEAALVTNRTASAGVRRHLSDSGLIDFAGLPDSLKATISTQLGGLADSAAFFASFHLFFKEPSLEILHDALQQRFFRLGGTSDGWSGLLEKIRRWINRRDEPPPDGTITLTDVRAAALWHLPPPIPQGFHVPDDYVAPELWSKDIIQPRLRAGGERVLVLTGSPGAGKSTYLSWLVHQLRDLEVPVVRHHFFLSITDPTPRRTEWETAADSIITQIHSSYGSLVRTVDSKNPLPDTLRTFLAAAGQARRGKAPLVVIVDGLDHVWRNAGSDEDLRRLFDLLLPVPEGVFVLVGTQDIDLARIPLKLRDLCPRERWLELPLLDGGDIHQWLQHHEAELGLPKQKDQAGRVLGELSGAFHEVSGGHPLVLHYAFRAARQASPSICPDSVRALATFDPKADLAAYYRTTLWDSIGPEGHHLLHLLAGFPWAWPRDGLVQCLDQHADAARLEQSERAVRHVLGTSRAGVTAFHESLLAFIRALPEHEATVRSLRGPVINWLTHRAPEYWRWRHEWEERAKDGDTAPLILSATLDWSVNSLADGRDRTAIGEVVAASGLAALREGRLGTATERNYIDAYLEESRHARSVLSPLFQLALYGHDVRQRQLELELFLSRVTRATPEEVAGAAEAAFSYGMRDVCDELLDESMERWNAAIRRYEHEADGLSSLREVFPFMIAASLATPSQGPYQRHVSKHGAAPSWCPHGHYTRALARLIAVGDNTQAAREELRYLGNDERGVCFEAADEIVRLSCRDRFDPNGWVTNPEARRSGLFRCARLWIWGAGTPPDQPRDVSFQSISRDVGWDVSAFVELARAYFFSCLASATEGHAPGQPIALSTRSSKVSNFLSMLRDLGIQAATSKKAGEPVGGAWLVARLQSITSPDVPPNDYDNHLARPEVVAPVLVAIMQDLEELYYAESEQTSLSREAIERAIKSGRTWPGVWIADRVQRRLTMRDVQAARLLIDLERARLRESRDYLHTRAEEYAKLGIFCALHLLPREETQELGRLAARNLMGHGSHKDTVLFDVLGAVRVASPGMEVGLVHLRSISPIIQVVTEITDGDETRHLKRELAEVLAEVAPEVLPPYLRALQRHDDHWAVESCFTDIARSASLQTEYERALGSTLVHEEALTTLQERAENGDVKAGTLLGNSLRYCGRLAVAPRRPDAQSTFPKGGRDSTPPAIEDYPPERLAEFAAAVRDAGLFDDEHLAAWTEHWRSADPDGLLNALGAYRRAQGRPLERRNARGVVALALERQGQAGAWEWLLAYHDGAYGWNQHIYGLGDVDWIWNLVRESFSTRWLDFIVATSQPRWRATTGAPSWSAERMVRFLKAVGRGEKVGEVVEAAVRWATRLAADMHLPDPDLIPDDPPLPAALRLLVDRLDCPSRMVQERAAWTLARFLSDADTREDTTRALLQWHAPEPVEMRSCMLLLLLHLARTAHQMLFADCVAIARQATLVPSIATSLLLREFGDQGSELAKSLEYCNQYSGRPPALFSSDHDFAKTVKAHLAPIFLDWASLLDKSKLGFSRQWEWEASELARIHGLSLRPGAHHDYHYGGGIDGPGLPINDRLSAVLRSAYLRALHGSIADTKLDVGRAEIHARRVGLMADPAYWAVRASERPAWWPADLADESLLDTIAEGVGKLVKTQLENGGLNQRDVLVFAAGPIGHRPRLRADLTIRAFLQSAHGPGEPSQDELAKLPWISSRPLPPRVSLPGSYVTCDESSGWMRDWLVAPIASRLEQDSNDWLLPERQARGIQVPATWLLAGTPSIETEQTQILVKVGEQAVARYHHWHDDLRERHYYGAGPRVGGALLVQRQHLEPHLARGASLCWIVTLSVSEREEYKREFGEQRIVGTWLVGGSRVIRPTPWRPPS